MRKLLASLVLGLGLLSGGTAALAQAPAAAAASAPAAAAPEAKPVAAPASAATAPAAPDEGEGRQERGQETDPAHPGGGPERGRGERQHGVAGRNAPIIPHFGPSAEALLTQDC